MGSTSQVLKKGGKETITMTDTHIAVAVIFDVPAGEDYRSYFPKFYSKVKAGTKDCLYYGFATCGNKVLCREGYKNGEALRSHMGDIKDELEGMIKKIGKERVKILCSGPPAELEKIKPLDTRLSDQITIVELDSGALNLKSFQNLLSQQEGWMNSKQGSPSSIPLLRMDPEVLDVSTMGLVLPGILSIAVRGTRMLRLASCMELISRECWRNQ